MKLKFVEDNVVQHKTRGRKPAYDWPAFMEELYKFPNKWAEFPEKIAHSATAYRLIDVYKDIDVRVSGGNNLALSDPNKQFWTVYIKYIPPVPEDDTF